MPYRIAGLDAALRSTASTRDDANMIREHIIEALSAWPTSALRAGYEVIPFNCNFNSELRGRAQAISDILHQYLTSHDGQFAENHLRSIIDTAIQIGY
jgi:hypothetical protein